MIESVAKSVIGSMRPPVRVPEWNDDRLISSMRTGDYGYAVPWALFQNKGNVFIDGGYFLGREEFGTSPMLVVCSSDGFECYPREKYRIYEEPIINRCAMPVVLLEYDEALRQKAQKINRRS